MIRILVAVMVVDDIVEQAGQKLGRAHVVADVESTGGCTGSGGVIPRLVVVRRLKGREDVLEGRARCDGGGHRA